MKIHGWDIRPVFAKSSVDVGDVFGSDFPRMDRTEELPYDVEGTGMETDISDYGTIVKG